MVNLTLVPFGNAHIGTFGKLSCQHGEEECEGNRYAHPQSRQSYELIAGALSWEQCAIHLYPGPNPVAALALTQ